MKSLWVLIWRVLQLLVCITFDSLLHNAPSIYLYTVLTYTVHPEHTNIAVRDCLLRANNSVINCQIWIEITSSIRWSLEWLAVHSAADAVKACTLHIRGQKPVFDTQSRLIANYHSTRQHEAVHHMRRDMNLARGSLSASFSHWTRNRLERRKWYRIFPVNDKWSTRAMLSMYIMCTDFNPSTCGAAHNSKMESRCKQYWCLVASRTWTPITVVISWRALARNTKIEFHKKRTQP